MKIPHKVKVGALIYKVEIVDDLEDDKSAAKLNYKTLTIKIEKAEPTFMKQAFLHELFHAINAEMSEEHVEFLSMALNQVISDNPEVFNGE